MKKKFFIILLIFLFSNGLAKAGQEIAAVQSIRIPPYEEALKGFKSVCNSKIRRLVLSDMERGGVIKKIDEIRPDMVLAIGMDALSRVKRIKHIPIVYLMALNPQSLPAGNENITGVSMNICQERQLRTFSKCLPHMKHIGLLYDPERTGHLVKKARDAAGRIGITLIAKKVYESRDVPQLIEEMKGKIDAFWMLPDITVITPETLEFLFLFSLENKIPVLTFSDKYLGRGALISIGIDAFDIGIQAGEMTNKLLSGKDAADVHRIDARKATIHINRKIARKLKIHIDKRVIREAIITD